MLNIFRKIITIVHLIHNFGLNNIQLLNTMNKLQFVLNQQGRSQLWLANQLDITKSTMSTWCTNRSQPSLEKLYKIAEILNVDVTDLLVTKKQLIELLTDKENLKKNN